MKSSIRIWAITALTLVFAGCMSDQHCHSDHCGHTDPVIDRIIHSRQHARGQDRQAELDRLELERQLRIAGEQNQEKHRRIVRLADENRRLRELVHSNQPHIETAPVSIVYYRCRAEEGDFLRLECGNEVFDIPLHGPPGRNTGTHVEEIAYCLPLGSYQASVRNRARLRFRFSSPVIVSRNPTPAVITAPDGETCEVRSSHTLVILAPPGYTIRSR